MSDKETDRASLDAKMKVAREGVQAFRKKYKEFYPGSFDGARAVPRPPMLTGCTVVSERMQIIERLPKGGVFAEVGTLQGNFITKVIDIYQPSALHLFDRSFKPVLPENRAKLDAYGKVTYHEGDSSTLLAALPDATFDVVYVDGDHGYDGVWKDLVQAIRVMKPDGHIVCNDYTNWDPLQMVPIGVFAAVNRFVNENNLRFEYLALNPFGFHDVALRRAGA